MTGLIEPQAGRVSYDGRPLDELRQAGAAPSGCFGLSGQCDLQPEPRENVAFSNTVDDASLVKALRTAELGEFLATLPEGLDTLVSERGTSLSGGQKQRIMLARALALNPKVLLLDDFTARVDQRTERQILDNVRRNYPA